MYFKHTHPLISCTHPTAIPLDYFFPTNSLSGFMSCVFVYVCVRFTRFITSRACWWDYLLEHWHLTSEVVGSSVRGGTSYALSPFMLGC